MRALAEREGLDLCRVQRVQRLGQRPADAEPGRAPERGQPRPQLRALAKERGWPIHDFRKGRRATIIAIPVAAGAGVIAGGVAAGIAVRRHRADRLAVAR